MKGEIGSLGSKFIPKTFDWDIVSRKKPELIFEIQKVFNKLNIDNAFNTPDFLLARFVVESLEVFAAHNKNVEKWCSKE